MPEAVKARYDKMVKNKDFPNKEVKSWKNFLDASGKWEDVPSLDPLPEKYETMDLDSLYRILLETFYNMSLHTNKLDDDTKDFLNTYFGASKTFHMPKMSTAEEDQIKAFLNLLFNNPDVRKLGLVNGEDKSILFAAQNNPNKLNDPLVKRAISNAIGQFRRYELSGYELSNNAGAQALNALDLEAIESIADTTFETIQPEPNDIDKLREDVPKIFKTLYKKKKTYEAFKKYESGNKIISEQIDEALSETDYTGKIKPENLVKPKYEDQLNLGQKIEKHLKEDVYSDVLKKFLTLHRDRLVMHKTSGEIIKTLEKEKIKPTDGLEAIIEKSEGIVGKLKGKEPFAASEHFEWLISKLKNYKDNGMGKAIKAALHNRRQLEHIVEQLIFDAVEEGKVEHAKTALEVLSIMQYGMFNSRAMNALNGMDPTLLSDPNLSFNKNPYIKGVLKALDWTLKKGGQLFGYALTAMWNKGVRSQSHVLENSQKLKDAMNKERANLVQKRDLFRDEKDAQDQNDKDLIDAGKALISTSGITDLQAAKNDLHSKKEDLTNAENALKKPKEDFDKADAEYQQKNQAYEQANQQYEQEKQKQKEKQETLKKAKALVKKQEALRIKVAQIDKKLRGIKDFKNQKIAADIEELKEERKRCKDEIKKTKEELNQIAKENPELTKKTTSGKRQWVAKIPTNPDLKAAKTARDNAEAERKSAETEYNNKKAVYETAETAYDTARKKVDTQEMNIALYIEGKEQIKAAEEAMAKRAEKESKWDENNKNGYAELMALWGFLQTGQTKTMLFCSTKRMQDRMDAGEMAARFSAYRNTIGY